MAVDILKHNNVSLAMNPKKFALWLFVVSIIMIFAALTSAYIVRQAEGNWLDFDLPTIFWPSTIVLLVSSITMHLAYYNAKKNATKITNLFLYLTAILGSAFLVMQFLGWKDLVNRPKLNGVDLNVYFAGPQSNPAGSFLYVLSGLHGFHIICGLVFLLIVVIQSIKGKVNSNSILSIELCTTFWHFLDALWLYLFLFLFLNR